MPSHHQLSLLDFRRVKALGALAGTREYEHVLESGAPLPLCLPRLCHSFYLVQSGPSSGQDPESLPLQRGASANLRSLWLRVRTGQGPEATAAGRE